MANYDTIPGAAYVVTAKTDTTVTDASGLVLEVSAGEQRGFLATTESVAYTGVCTFAQVRGNFSLPSTDGGGGGQIVIDPTPTQWSPNAVSSGGVYTALRALPAPVPEPLEEDTAMRNGGVYTVAADIDAQNVTLAEHATAAIIVSSEDGPIPNMQLPAWKWCTDDGLQPKLDYFRVYRMEVMDDGFYTSARLVSQYATASEWMYTAMSSQTATTGDIVYVQAETHEFSSNLGARWFSRKDEGTNFREGQTALDGSELPFSLIRDDRQFLNVATIKFSSAKKFKAVTLSLTNEYGGSNALYFQAWNADAEQWVDVSDIVTNNNEKIYTVVPIYDSAPRSDKWRVVCGSARCKPGFFRFFEA